MGEGDYSTRGETLTTVAGANPLVESDPSRVALIVSLGTVNPGIYLQAEGAPDGDHRIYFGAENPVHLTFRDHGPLPAYAWSVVDPAGNSTVSVIGVYSLMR